MSTAKESRAARRPRMGCALVALVASATAIGAVPAGAAATVPGPPTITSAVAIMQGVTLGFRSPASDGDARIFDYHVTCTSTDGGLKVERVAAKSPITISGMSVNRHYQCVVAARNSVGVGPASKPSATFVPIAQDAHQLPDAPAAVHVRAEVGSIFVTYSKFPIGPGRTRLSVVKYRAKCASSNGGVTHREQRTWTMPGILVHNLTAGKTYHCTVSASNSNGFGPSSSPSAAVVPLSPPSTPSAPTITSATAIVRGITIAFATPASNGGSPVIDYRLECTSTNGGVAAERTVPRRSPYSAVGLSAGKRYTCRLAAHNKIGVGTFSAPSPPAVPLSA